MSLFKILAGTQILFVKTIVPNVGIGTTGPNYKLDVQGGGVNTSGAYTNVSDRRYKQDIVTLDQSLEKVLRLRGVTYDWRRDEFPEKNFSEAHQVGVIAQEVEVEYPELVATNAQGYKSVNYSALVAPLIEAVKALYQRLLNVEAKQSGQDRRIASLEDSKVDKAAMEVLKAKNQQLEQENKAIKARLDKIEKLLNAK